MELDDLKKQWKDTPTASSPDAIREAIEKKIPSLEHSGRKIRRAFFAEMIVVALIYLGFFTMMILLNEGIELYMYKLIIVTTVATIPIVWRLYKSQRWVNSMDYTVDVRTNVIAFVKYYKRTLLMYEWGTYIIVLLVFVMLFTDGSFQNLPRSVKIAVSGYVLLVTLFTRPYIRFAYGRKITVFEDFLKE